MYINDVMVIKKKHLESLKEAYFFSAANECKKSFLFHFFCANNKVKDGLNFEKLLKRRKLKDHFGDL